MLRVVDPQSVGNSWLEMRKKMQRARVVLGPHGSAWGNLIFAPMHRSNVHFIEFNWLRQRACYPKISHYVDGLSHYWTVEPAPRPQFHVWLSSQGHPMQMPLLYKPMNVSEDDVHTILWHAGVADCCRVTGELRVDARPSRYRCSADRRDCAGPQRGVCQPMC